MATAPLNGRNAPDAASRPLMPVVRHKGGGRRAGRVATRDSTQDSLPTLAKVNQRGIKACSEAAISTLVFPMNHSSPFLERPACEQGAVGTLNPLAMQVPDQFRTSLGRLPS